MPLLGRCDAPQRITPQVPVPRGHPLPRSGVLQGLVLQPFGAQAQRRREAQQAVPVGAHEVRHRRAAQLVPVKPNAAVEGETHALAAAQEFTVRALYVQVILPSTVALPIGAALPENR